MPITSHTAEYLYGVWGNGPNNAWTVGAAGTLLRQYPAPAPEPEPK